MNSALPAGNGAPAQKSFWKRPATWVGILVYTVFCLYVFRDLFFSGEPVVSSLGGDSVKNLFTFLYSATYDGGSLHFTGMNYPFGEHLSFADAQPLAAVVLGSLQKNLHLSPAQLLYTMYAAVALSFVVGMVYTQRLLQHFGVNALLSVSLSAIIIILSPHTIRYTGHFPLAYASLLPMLFYWSVQYYETNRKRFLLKLFFLFGVCSFLHLYFLAIGLLWSASYFLGALLLRRGKAGKPLWHGTLFLLPAVATFALTKIFFAFTDSVADRTVVPYAGGYEQGGGLQMLTSSFSPIWVALRDSKIITKIHEEPGEFCYLGFVPLLLLVVLGILAATGFWKKLSAGQRPFNWQWLFIAGFTLLFASTIKYYWEAGIFNELLRPLRQFRTQERFSWIGYYVLSVSAAIVLYRMCHYWWAQGKKVSAAALGILVTALWAFDAGGNMAYVHKSNENAIGNGRYFFSKETSWKDLVSKNGYKPTDFEALLSLPYVHVGSEKLWLSQFESYGLTSAYKAAMEMQLPIMDVYMSRSSWSQTFESVRLAGGYYTNQSLLRRIANEKPLLLSRFRGYPITPEEALFLQPEVADSLGQIDDCVVFAFWPQKFLRRQAAKIAEAQAIATAMTQTDTVLSSSLPYYLNHMETPGGTEAFAGRGSSAPIKDEDSVFAALDFPTPLAVPVQYEFSAWSRFPAVGYRSNNFYLKCTPAANEEASNIEVFGVYSTDNAPGMWFRVSKHFEVPAGTRRIEMGVRNTNGISYERMDEVLLRPSEALVISKMIGGKILVNNHLLRP